MSIPLSAHRIRVLLKVSVLALRGETQATALSPAGRLQCFCMPGMTDDTKPLGVSLEFSGLRCLLLDVSPDIDIRSAGCCVTCVVLLWPGMN